MKIFVEWERSCKEFSDHKHSLGDCDVISFEMQHSEGEIAKLRIVLPQSSAPEKDKRWICLCFQDDVVAKPAMIFRGVQSGIPKWLDRGLIELSYYAVPNDHQKQVSKLVEKIRTEGPYDELFFIDQDDPTNVLEGREEVFYYDRYSRNVDVSNIIRGRKIVNLTDYVWEGSLISKLSNNALESIEVTVQAKWTQQIKGAINVFPKIAKAFSKGIVNTITPQALERFWPKEGDRIGHEGSAKNSGYQVIESKLIEFDPSYSGSLEICPTLTSPIAAKDQDSVRKVYFPRKWFNGRLIVMWNYIQRRQENAKLTIRQNFPGDFVFGKSKKLVLNVNHLQEHCEKDASFFTTERGHKAIAYAIEVAKAYLVASSRCLEITVEFDWIQAFELDLDTTITLKHPTLPDGEIKGKVVAYKFKQDGGYRRGWARILAVLGDRHYEQIENSGRLDNELSVSVTKSGIRFGTVYDQKPTLGIVDAKLGIDDIVEYIKVHNDGEIQSRILKDKQYPVTDHPNQILKEIPTTIEMSLKDMRTQPEIIHNIILPVLTNISNSLV